MVVMVVVIGDVDLQDVPNYPASPHGQFGQ
jgi:hypothetical protein